MLELLLLGAGLAVFLIVTAVTMDTGGRAATSAITLAQYRPRSAQRPLGAALNPLALQGARRAARGDSANARYLRQLKQANWFWAPGEPAMPSPRAPFWNLETLWAEKFIGAALYGGLAAGAVATLGILLAVALEAPPVIAGLAALAVGGVGALMGWTGPDSALAGAAAARQRELALEMGFRLPELRSDVMAGQTIQRAMRNMARRPGGPFIEEMRRIITVLDTTRSEAQAMEQFIDRNRGNELAQEFATVVRMVTTSGGEIGPALDVLADAAQQKLKLQITAQGRKNTQEMTRPIGLGSMIVMSLLVIAPALAGIAGSIQ